MTIFRTLFSLRAWVLAWFVLALGVAVASPVVQPRSMEIVCSSTGATKILVHTSTGSLELGMHGSECPLCLVSGAPSTPPSSLPPVLRLIWPPWPYRRQRAAPLSPEPLLANLPR